MQPTNLSIHYRSIIDPLSIQPRGKQAIIDPLSIHYRSIIDPLLIQAAFDYRSIIDPLSSHYRSIIDPKIIDPKVGSIIFSRKFIDPLSIHYRSKTLKNYRSKKKPKLRPRAVLPHRKFCGSIIIIDPWIDPWIDPKLSIQKLDR